MADALEAVVKSADVVFFDMPGCPFCSMAEKALRQNKIEYKKVDIARYKPALRTATGKTSAPSVWIKGTYIGGCNDGTLPWHGVRPMLNNGKFKQMLSEGPPSTAAPPAPKPDSLEAVVKSADVVFFDMVGCPFCEMAEDDLQAKGIAFKKVDIARYKPELKKTTGKSSAPSVWIKGTYVGGCNDGTLPWHGVRPMLKNGKFQQMLSEGTPSPAVAPPVENKPNNPPSSTLAPPVENKPTSLYHQQVVDKYTSLSSKEVFNPTDEQADYPADLRALVPSAVFGASCGGGNPFALGKPARGQCVVDLGCGAGPDLCISAVLVGASGRVLGIDMNAAMLSRAQSNVDLTKTMQTDIAQVSFVEAPFDNPEHQALKPYLGQFDVVLSNGALCLSFDMPKAIETAFALLQPGGIFQLFDLCKEDGSVPKGMKKRTQTS